MKNKRMLIFSFVLLFIFSISFLVYKSTFSYVDNDLVSVNVDKTKLQELIARTAYAFYNRNEYIQYDSTNMLGIEDKFMFREFNISPEDININNQVNMDNISFLHSVYKNSINYDLAKLSNNESDISKDVGFSYEDLEAIIANEDDVRNVFTGYTEHYISGEELSKAFVLDFKAKLEVGDIVVYATDMDVYAYLYLGDNKYMYADGKDYSSLNSDFLDNGTLYITDSIFLDDKIDSEILYYSIIRPINEMIDGNGNANAVSISVNSLARIDGVYVNKYTDIAAKDVYDDQKINYFIEIKNENSKKVKIYEIKDYIESNLTFISEKSNYNGEFTDSTVSSDSFIKWTEVSVPADSSITLSYEVIVRNSRVFKDKTQIGIPEDDYTDGISTIKFVDDGYTMKLNDIDFNSGIVFNDSQSEKIDSIVEEIVKLNGGIEYSTDSKYQDEYKTKISEINENNPIHLYSHSFIKFIYYNALGLDLGNNDGLLYPNTILNNLFKYNDDGSYSRIFKSDDIVGKKVNNMVVASLFGGKLLNTSSSRTKMITMPYYSSVTDKFSYTYKEFIPGDVICYWNKDNNWELKAFSYMFLGSTYDNDSDSYTGKFIRYSGTGISVISGTDANDFINSLYSSDLFVVLRPSKVNYILADSIEMEDFVISVGEITTIKYNKVPVNATIVSKEAESSDNKIFEITDKQLIKGIGSGTGKLTVKFELGNGELITKEVNVTVTNEEDIINMETDYLIDKDNKIIYTGFDNKIDTVKSKIRFNESVDVTFVNEEGTEITDLIDEKITMEVRYNDVLIYTYKIVAISSETLAYDVDSNQKVIKYFEIGSTVSDILELMQINLDSDEYTLTVYSNDSAESLVKVGSAILATGDIIDIKLSDNTTIRYIVSVLGDVNGDGKFKLTDLIKIRRHFVEYLNPQTGIVEIQTGANYFSMDINQDGNIKLSDIIAFRKRLIEEYE